MSGAETEKYSVLKKLGKAVEWVVGLIVLALVLMTLWLFLGGESADVSIPDDSDLRVVLPEIADEDNGFIAIVASTNLIVMETNSLGDIDMTFAREYASPRTYGCERVRAEPGAAEKADKILADNAAFFAAFSRGLERKAFRNVEPKMEIAKGYGFAFPPIKAYNCAKFLWCLKVQREIERGELDKAQESLETIRRFGRAVSDNALSAVEYLVGGSVCSAGPWKIADMAAADGLDDAALARLAAFVYADRKRHSENVKRVLKLDYSAMRANLEALTPEMMAELNGFATGATRKLANMMHSAMGFEVKSPLYERICDRIAQAVLHWPGYFRYTFHRRTTIARIAETTRLAIKGEVDSAADDDGYDGLLTRNGYGRNIVAVHACGCRSLLSADARAFERGQALLAIAAARWRLVHGDAMPPSLEALVPQFLDAVPVDPYSKDGSPFQYDAETGVAWSVGNRARRFDYMKVKDDEQVVEALAKGQMYAWAFRIDGRPAPLNEARESK